MNKITIGVVDDHQIIINGFKVMLSNMENLEVTIHASSGPELLKLLENEQPDLLFMDIQMPVMDGISLGKLVKKLYPSIKIIAFSSFDDSHYIKQFLRSSASGYILKNADRQTLINAIEQVMN